MESVVVVRESRVLGVPGSRAEQTKVAGSTKMQQLQNKWKGATKREGSPVVRSRGGKVHSKQIPLEESKNKGQK